MISPPAKASPLILVRWRSGPPRRLDLTAGGSCVLLGPSGSGKSAVMQAVASAASTAAVDVALFGVACGPGVGAGARASLRHRLGVMLQDVRLADELSVIGNLALAATAAGRRFADYRSDALEVLAWVGLKSRLFDAAAELDAEGRRRLALARALVNGPDVLIADEPTEGLAAKARNGLLRLVGDVHAAGTAVLLATRDPSLASASGGEVTDLSAPQDAELAGAA
ncbi:MAG TPA: ATP-binding cassette domain-containing protein [Caulobacteraceae bacterium]|nr:ATP-binding cassette domain-containing protein [Caulobacteraceae bacterium]